MSINIVIIDVAVISYKEVKEILLERENERAQLHHKINVHIETRQMLNSG